MIDALNKTPRVLITCLRVQEFSGRPHRQVGVAWASHMDGLDCSVRNHLAVASTSVLLPPIVAQATAPIMCVHGVASAACGDYRTKSASCSAARDPCLSSWYSEAARPLPCAPRSIQGKTFRRHGVAAQPGDLPCNPGPRLSGLSAAS